MIFASMKLAFGLVLISFLFLSCNQALIADSSTAVPTAEELYLSKAELVVSGMSEDDVSKILGPAHRFITTAKGNGTCKEFQYPDKDGIKLLVLVWFDDGHVSAVARKSISECYLDIL